MSGQSGAAPMATAATTMEYIVMGLLAEVHPMFVAAALCRRDQRFDQRPFSVNQITRITQLIANDYARGGVKF